MTSCLACGADPSSEPFCGHCCDEVLAGLVARHNFLQKRVYAKLPRLLRDRFFPERHPIQLVPLAWCRFWLVRTYPILGLLFFGLLVCWLFVWAGIAVRVRIPLDAFLSVAAPSMLFGGVLGLRLARRTMSSILRYYRSLPAVLQQSYWRRYGFQLRVWCTTPLFLALLGVALVPIVRYGSLLLFLHSRWFPMVFLAQAGLHIVVYSFVSAGLVASWRSNQWIDLCRKQALAAAST